MASEDDKHAPASPAAPLSISSAPSAAVAELQARAADAAAAAEAEAQRTADAASEAQRKEAAKKAAARESEARAPTSPFRAMRFFYVAFVGGIALTFFICDLMEDIGVPRTAYLAFATLWAIAAMAIAIDGVTWRKRLGFALDGFDRIEGGHTFDDGEAPWVAFRIHVDLRDASAVSSDARAAAQQTCEILAQRVNAILAKDEDNKDGKRTWRVQDGVCTGQGNRGLYTTRVIEKWLRDDVKLLSKAYAVERVVVKAAFTGATEWIRD